MKRLPLFLFLATFFATAVFAQTPADEAAKLYSQAQRLYVAGRAEEAKVMFEDVLLLNPKHTGATNYLRTINAQQKAAGPGAAVARNLEKTIIPEVKFQESTLDSVLAYLPTLFDKSSNGALKTSFVIKVPEAQLAGKKITLNLTNVPASEVLRYLGTLADIRFQPEAYAIMVLPVTEPAPQKAAETGPAQNPG